MSYFGFSKDNPYHLSVGAVLRNNEGKIAVHHFEQFEQYTNFYILMRETIEPNETIEGALARGLSEEFGATASLDRYMGSIVCNFKAGNATIQKTTLYFLMDVKTLGDWPTNDAESAGALEWHDPAFLIDVMKSQAKRLRREDADESSVLERL